MIKALKPISDKKVINTIDSKYSLKKGAVLSSEVGPTVGLWDMLLGVRTHSNALYAYIHKIGSRTGTTDLLLSADSHDVLVTCYLHAIFGFTINNPFISWYIDRCRLFHQ